MTRTLTITLIVAGLIVGSLGLVLAADDTLLQPGATKVRPAGTAAPASPAKSAAKPATSAAKPATPAVKSNPGAFLTECMRVDMGSDTLQIIMWLPQEFFIQVEMQGLPSLSRDDAAKAMSMVEPYLVMIGCRGMQDEKGTFTKTLDEPALRQSVHLLLADGTKVAPLDDELPEKAKTVVEAMKNALARQQSVRMKVLVFPRKDAKGKPIVDEQRRDKLVVVMDAIEGFPESKMVFRTPFDAASAACVCPGCKETISPKWTFCPWCGKKLPPLAARN